jgi:hypothetical protein
MVLIRNSGVKNQGNNELMATRGTKVTGRGAVLKISNVLLVHFVATRSAKDSESFLSLLI